LENHYRTNFALKHFHHWSLTELENMMPFERDIYVALLNAEIEMEKERARTQGNG
jgi:hypothetical protein